MRRHIQDSPGFVRPRWMDNEAYQEHLMSEEYRQDVSAPQEPDDYPYDVYDDGSDEPEAERMAELQEEGYSAAMADAIIVREQEGYDEELAVELAREDRNFSGIDLSGLLDPPGFDLGGER